jgi:hypothetical protein
LSRKARRLILLTLGCVIGQSPDAVLAADPPCDPASRPAAKLVQLTTDEPTAFIDNPGLPTQAVAGRTLRFDVAHDIESGREALAQRVVVRARDGRVLFEDSVSIDDASVRVPEGTVTLEASWTEYPGSTPGPPCTRGVTHVLTGVRGEIPTVEVSVSRRDAEISFSVDQRLSEDCQRTVAPLAVAVLVRWGSTRATATEVPNERRRPEERRRPGIVPRPQGGAGSAIVPAESVSSCACNRDVLSRHSRTGADIRRQRPRQPRRSGRWAERV